MATPEGAGIWIGDKTFVAIHNINGQCCLAVGKVDQPGGHAFAISVDNNGEPALQVCRPGKPCVVVSGDALQAMFEKA